MLEEKKIVFYGPNGEGLHGKGIMLNLQRLVVDKFKRGGNSSQEEIDKFGKSWILADILKHCPKQENGESVRHICVFGCAPAPLTSPLTTNLIAAQHMIVVFLHFYLWPCTVRALRWILVRRVCIAAGGGVVFGVELFT